jgi:hypothetical protein
MDQTKLMVIVLAVFIIVAAAQTVQIGILMGKVKEANIGSGTSFSSSALSAGSQGAGSSASPSASPSGNSGSSPASLKNLPQMVGGC